MEPIRFEGFSSRGTTLKMPSTCSAASAVVFHSCRSVNLKLSIGTDVLVNLMEERFVNEETSGKCRWAA